MTLICARFNTDIFFPVIPLRFLLRLRSFLKGFNPMHVCALCTMQCSLVGSEARHGRVWSAGSDNSALN